MLFRCCSALVLALVVLLPTGADAMLRLSGFYGDNMLFQRGRPLVLSGWAEPGESVAVSDDRASVTVVADAAGRWRAELPSREAASALTLRVRTRSMTRELRNVAIGELWFASGQSNMAWPMAWIVSRHDDIKAANLPNLRVMSVQQRPARLPQSELNGEWYAATPDHVREFSATAFHFGRSLQQALGVPVGVINSSWGGSRIEPWISHEAFQKVAAPHMRAHSNLHNHSWAPAALYNGMVHPLGQIAVRGILWYQGEANLNEGQAYLPKLEALISGWRGAWRMPQLPFLFAQIAPLDYSSYGPNKSPTMLPEFWEMQADALRIPATGLATTLDLNPGRSLHPDEKREVGERFAALALQTVYGRAVVGQSPMYARRQLDGGTMRIHWRNASGLRTTDGLAPRGFELAGPSGVFLPAQARIDGESVVLHHPAIPAPQAVRFAWQSLPDVNLVNAAGLPAYPFRDPRTEPRR